MGNREATQSPAPRGRLSDQERGATIRVPSGRGRAPTRGRQGAGCRSPSRRPRNHGLLWSATLKSADVRRGPRVGEAHALAVLPRQRLGERDRAGGRSRS